MNKYEMLLDTNVFDNDDLKLIKELVERATPKKIAKDINYLTYGKCLSCYTVTTKAKYCFNCGQALDWSDDNE